MKYSFIQQCIFVFLRIPLIPYLENLPLGNTEWPFSLFCFLDELLWLHFFTRCLYFYHNWWWERDKINLSSIVKDWGESFGNSLTLLTLCNLHNQKTEFHTKSEDISEIKLDSLLPSARNSHLIIWTVIVFNIFYLILIIALPLIRFWIIGS